MTVNGSEHDLLYLGRTTAQLREIENIYATHLRGDKIDLDAVEQRTSFTIFFRCSRSLPRTPPLLP